MAAVKNLLANIQKAHDERASTIKRLLKEQAALKKAGIDYGAPHYKQKKYLRIVKPSEGGKRDFVYVGADPVKQKIALDALERGRQYDALEEQAQAVRASLDALKNSLSVVIRELEWSPKDAADF